MHHLNYCRQMTKQFIQDMGNGGNKKALSHAVDLAETSMKFLLPDGGRLLDDKELKALDETVPLRLPYKFIALEYSRQSLGIDNVTSDESLSTKAIIFAREREDYICIMPIAWFDSRKSWGPLPEICIPNTNFIDRAVKDRNGRVMVKVMNTGIIPLEDYADELGVLLCFLNILRCSNVNIEKSDQLKKKHKVKAALKFDDYHVLTIDAGNRNLKENHNGGTHRSPREHLRMGHIRILSDGRRIWVNATVVCAGRGAGVVTKDYKLRCSNPE